MQTPVEAIKKIDNILNNRDKITELYKAAEGNDHDNESLVAKEG